MLASVLSVLAGYVVWTLVFLGGAAGIRAVFASAHDADGGTSSVAVLLGYLVLSMLASLAAGFVAARLAPARRMRHVWIVAGLLLATGLPVQVSTWDTLPVWYHVVFLLALVPVTVLGGRLQSGRVV